ncbi:MAG TPA: citrate/2-methylcitrate synthase [Gammaproteobacteria bacterium]|nr:citrate/2-methylcitrate synthase [Gammaproteobacteria bacterium]
MRTDKPAWVDAKEATALLGVTRATLYAYVSRGRIRSESAPGSARRRRYARDDVERLRARARERRNPEKAAEQALHWGLPILESAITLIGDGRVYYRGRDAAELARTSSLAEVAALIWTGKTDVGPLGESPRAGAAARAGSAAPFVARAQAALALAAPSDPLAYDLRPHAVARTGWRILHQLALVAAGSSSESTIDAALAAAWGVSRHVDLIRAALILCADHELNVSAFTARCVASAGSSPYAVVIAGLAALEGTKHGGSTVRMEAFWDALRRSARLRGGFADRLRRGEAIEGFGHPLYPRGDPRAAVLLARLPKTKAAKYARDLVSAAHDVLGEAPNVDFALVALARALGLPDGAALTLFAIGRTIGWIGHAIEQYRQNAIIRPRAKYVGENPPA